MVNPLRFADEVGLPLLPSQREFLYAMYQSSHTGASMCVTFPRAGRTVVLDLLAAATLAAGGSVGCMSEAGRRRALDLLDERDRARAEYADVYPHPRCPVGHHPPEHPCDHPTCRCWE